MVELFHYQETKNLQQSPPPLVKKRWMKKIRVVVEQKKITKLEINKVESMEDIAKNMVIER